MKGNKVDIISGVHGLPGGQTIKDASFLAEDFRAFGNIPGVTIHDFSSLGQSGLSNILNSSKGSVIGGFCNSAACLGPLLK